MKKIIVALTLVLTLSLAGCTETPLECDTGKIETDGVCVLEELVCEDGQHIENLACVDDDVVVLDTTAPVLDGLVDVELPYGATFGDMTGVSATDDTDGRLTDDVVVTGAVNVMLAGEYVLTYTVSDAAGNEAVRTRTITVLAEPTEWIGYGHTMARVDDEDVVTYADVPATWWTVNAQFEIAEEDIDAYAIGIMFTFTGVLDHTYLFKAEGDSAVELAVTATGAEQTLELLFGDMSMADIATLDLLIMFPTTVGGAGSISLGEWTYISRDAEWIGYGYTVAVEEGMDVVTYTNVNDPWWNENAQFEIDAADVEETATGIMFTFTGVLDQVYLFKAEGDVAVELAVTATGAEQELTLDISGFTEAQRATIDLFIVFPQTIGEAGTIVLAPWEYVGVVEEMVWVGYDMTVVEADGNVSITYADISTDGWFNKNAQLAYTEFDGAVESVVFTFTGVSGHAYFFKLEGPGGISELGITADGTEQTLTVPLTNLDAAQRAQIAKLIVFGQTGGSSGTIVISDIEYVTPDPTVYDEWTGYGTTVAVAGDVTTITYVATPVEWWNNNTQYPVSDFDGTKEVVQFTFTGVLDQVYLFKLEGEGFATEVSAIGTGVEQMLLVPINQFTVAQRETISKIIVFVKTEGGAGSVALAPWTYPVMVMPTWNVYGDVVLTENVGSDTLTYGATPAEWWNNNAQFPFSTFDGTKTAIVFTFTGETGHLYLFKIEGGGVFAEVEATGTGVEQTVTLDLASMTEAQRDGLHLIVWFSKTAAATGSVEIVGWDYATE